MCCTYFQFVLLVIASLEVQEAVTSTDVNNCTNCPDGFFNDVLSCDKSTCELLVHSGYWPWSINGTPVVIECIAGYCGFNESDPYLRIPKEINIVDAGQVLCNLTNRRGVLCGTCQEGYGTSINSDNFDCVPCNDHNQAINWLYYVMSLFIPMFLIFLIIIVFNVRLTSGPANAFILYAQVISSTFDIFTDGQLPLEKIYGNLNLFRIAYQLFYNIFNLQFLANLLPPFCLSRQLNALDVVRLKYLEAISPIIMILAVVLFIKLQAYPRISSYFICCCHKYCRKKSGRRLGDSLVHAFAAFVLLSYTRFCLLSTYLISALPFKDRSMSPIGSPILLYDGDYSVEDGYYILNYKLPACIVFTTIIAIPPLVLLEYPVKLVDILTAKWTFLRRFYPAASINIVLDTFMGCFKDNRRYFAGIYFLFRLSLYIIYFTTVDSEQIAAQQFVVTVFIVLTALLRPYKKKFLNYVDILIFFNLATLNILSYYILVFYKLTPLQDPPLFAIVVHDILFFLPVVYMVGYLLYIFCHSSIVLSLLRKYRHGFEHPDELNNNTDTMDGDEQILERASNTNSYQSTSVTTKTDF